LFDPEIPPRQCMDITEEQEVVQFHHHHLPLPHPVTQANIHRRLCTRMSDRTAITSKLLPPSPGAWNTSSPVLYLAWALVSAMITPNSVLQPPVTVMTQTRPFHTQNNTPQLPTITLSRPQNSVRPTTPLRHQLMCTPRSNHYGQHSSPLKLRVPPYPPLGVLTQGSLHSRNQLLRLPKLSIKSMASPSSRAVS
jgi:hypothetical protein